MRNFFLSIMSLPVVAPLLLCSCEPNGTEIPEPDFGFSSLQDVAVMLSELPIGIDQMQEVYDAVDCSITNGYDEEYMMSDLLRSPGSGVRASESQTRASHHHYDRAMRDLIREYLSSRPTTRSNGSGDAAGSVEEQMQSLASSDVQIYWPYSKRWDGQSLPIITFDPGVETTVGVGYRIVESTDGRRRVESVMVDEQMAQQSPVWVVNTNNDSVYESLEVLRRSAPDWGQGGDVTIRKPSTRASGDGSGVRTLVLKDFTARRNFDPWLCGANEFFVKCGSVDGFRASTEAELRLYTPSVTDFMIVVRRSEVGSPRDFNAILISDWTDQLDTFGFMITEDDGGTRTSWKFNATVKIQSKSYGVELELPLNTRDDIVWRGGLSSRYFESYSGQTEHFGDVDLTFEVR